MPLRHPLLLILPFCVLALPACASEPASGQLAASDACEAYASFVKQSNPGAVRIAKGQSYQVREINKAVDYGWLRIDVPGATPPLRWVARACGTARLETAPAPAPALDRANQAGRRSASGSCNTPNQQDSYLLALSWQPGFCEHASFRGKKPECDAINSGKLAATNLTLHGLWPNKQSCGADYGSCDGPPFDLSKDTIARIAPWMPNFYFERTFGAYEWNKHGTCQALAPDAYFMKAVEAVRVVNDSEVGKIILGNIGGALRVTDFFARVEQRHGSQVANAITLVCVGKHYLQEIRINLPLALQTGGDLRALVGEARPTKTRTSGCGETIVIERAGKP